MGTLLYANAEMLPGNSRLDRVELFIQEGDGLHHQLALGIPVGPVGQRCHARSESLAHILLDDLLGPPVSHYLSLAQKESPLTKTGHDRQIVAHEDHGPSV